MTNTQEKTPRFICDRCEAVSSAAGTVLLRVDGVWAGPSSARLTTPSLLVTNGSETFHVNPLPGPSVSNPQISPAGVRWRAGYTISADVLDEPNVSFALDAGGSVVSSLPTPSRVRRHDTGVHVSSDMDADLPQAPANLVTSTPQSEVATQASASDLTTEGDVHSVTQRLQTNRAGLDQEQLIGRLQALESAYRSTSAQLASNEVTIADLQAKLQHATGQAEKHLVATEQIKQHHHSIVEEHLDKIDQLTRETAEHQAALEFEQRKTSDSIAATTTQVAELQAANHELTSNYSELQQQAEALRFALQETTGRHEQTLKQNEAAEAQRSELESKLQELDKANSELAQRIEQLQQSSEQSSKAVADANSLLESERAAMHKNLAEGHQLLDQELINTRASLQQKFDADLQELKAQFEAEKANLSSEAEAALKAEFAKSSELEAALTQQRALVERARQDAFESKELAKLEIEAAREEFNSQVNDEALKINAQFVGEIERLNSQLVAAQDATRAQVSRIAVFEQNLGAAHVENNQIRQQASELNEQLSVENSALRTEIHAQAARYNGELEHSQQSIREYAEQLETRQSEQDAYVGEVRKWAEDFKNEHTRVLEQLQSQIEGSETANARLQNEIESQAVQHQDVVETLTSRLNALQSELDGLSSQHEQQLTEIQSGAVRQYDEHEARIASLISDHAAEIAQLKSEQLAAVSQLQTEHSATISQLQDDHLATVSSLSAEQSAKETQHAAILSQIETDHQRQLDTAREEVRNEARAFLQSKVAESEALKAKLTQEVSDRENQLLTKLTERETQLATAVADREAAIARETAQRETKLAQNAAQLEAELTQQITELEVQVRERDSELDALNRRHQELLSWADEAKSHVADRDTMLDQKINTLKEAEDEIHVREQELHAHSLRISELESQLQQSQAQRQIETANLQSEVASTTQRHENAAQERTLLRKQLDEATAANVSLQQSASSRISQLEAELAAELQRNAGAAELENRFKLQGGALQEANATIGRLRQTVDQLQHKLQK